ncbi:hypothetical protein IWX75_002612 [Arthrobacter sp. CAN_A6]
MLETIFPAGIEKYFEEIERFDLTPPLEMGAPPPAQGA